MPQWTFDQSDKYCTKQSLTAILHCDLIVQNNFQMIAIHGSFDQYFQGLLFNVSASRVL